MCSTNQLKLTSLILNYHNNLNYCNLFTVYRLIVNNCFFLFAYFDWMFDRCRCFILMFGYITISLIFQVIITWHDGVCTWFTGARLSARATCFELGIRRSVMKFKSEMKKTNAIIFCSILQNNVLWFAKYKRFDYVLSIYKIYNLGHLLSSVFVFQWGLTSYLPTLKLFIKLIGSEENIISWNYWALCQRG